LSVGAIVRRFGGAFLRQYPHTVPGVVGTLDDLAACRTPARGGQVRRCRGCGLIDYRYHSCGNRHCPQCGGCKRAAWLEKRRAELLDVPYFHVVFTLPHTLSALVLGNRTLLYNLLFEAAAQTLLEVAANPRHLGARLGVLAVLHTWGQQLEHHPHVHCVVPGGGLACDASGAVEEPWRWRSCRPNYFLPVTVLKQVFRGKYVAGLRRAYQRGELRFAGTAALADPAAFETLLQGLYATDWVVYAKAPFGGPEQVLKYLTGYTHRVALSNSRLLGVTEEEVTFTWKDYAGNCQRRELTLSGVEFLRRFCLHVLPRGLVRIRQYGLLSNRDRGERLARCRELLGMSPQAAEARPGWPGGRLALGWWLLGSLLISSGSVELLAAGLQGWALALAGESEESCPWCGSCRWETLWQQERPRRADVAAGSDRGEDSS
jgi:hypothetical protein